MILATAFILSQLPALYASELHIKLPLPGTAINPGGETALGELALSSRPISLRVFPNLSCIIAPGDKIQLQVKALLENGGEIDVTNNRHTAYSSSDTVVVSVSSGGLVSALTSGQALIRVEYLNAVAYAEARANPQASVLGLNALFGVEDSSEMFPEETAPSASGTLAPGDRAQLSVMALLSDGETCHLTGNTGTTYVSGNTQVVNIDASGQIIAIGMGETHISVQAAGISTAAIAYVRLRDETAPVTSVFFSTPSHISPSGGVYISPYSLVHLDAADPVVESAFSSGVGFTGISIDEIPSAFADLWRYAPFSVIEGTYTFYFSSRDHAGNTEVVKSTTVTVDGTAPAVALLIAGSTVPDGGEVYLIEGDSITLEAIDPVSNGVA
ncbi:MAG TPA: hypothetical protein PK523_08400, partial [Elusimicrobiales bacterium]|nr:hypothetical protein [Elusimicrobiales bacterium]